jgi:Ran GTPase-activating protein (RanGAP) involved in mRNA processing and transport
LRSAAIVGLLRLILVSRLEATREILQALQSNLIDMGVSGAAAIVEALRLNSSLQHLDLWGNQIGDAGAASIADALKLNSSLQHLDLSSNQIGAAGAGAIAEALRLNSSLQHLDLCDNEIGDAGAAAFAELLEFSLSYSKQNWSTGLQVVVVTKENDKDGKINYFLRLAKLGFRSFIVSDASPALLPHALAAIRDHPSLIFYILQEIRHVW